MSRAIGWAIGAASLVAVGLLGSPAANGAGDPPDRQVEILQVGGGAYLGVRLQDVDKDDVARLKLSQERGALVESVEKDSPAAKAGLKDGDVILRYEGEAVLSAAQLARLVRETPSGRTVAMEVSRNGGPLKLSATLGPGGRRFHFGGDIVPPVPSIPPVPPIPPEAFRWEDFGKGGKFALRNHWSARGPRRLGIEYQEISGQLAKYFRLSEAEGVLVTSVEEDGPAARAGLKAGDVILKFGGKTVRDGADLRDAVAGAQAGQEVAVTVQRDGKPLELKLEVGAEKPRREPGSTT